MDFCLRLVMCDVNFVYKVGSYMYVVVTEYSDKYLRTQRCTLADTIVVGVMKMGNIAPRAGLTPISHSGPVCYHYTT